MPEEMKELLQEIEEALEKLDKSSLQESLKKLQLSNEDVEKELDRNLKLLKQLEFDQKLEKAINQLDLLAKKEQELSEKLIQKNGANEKQMERMVTNI